MAYKKTKIYRELVKRIGGIQKHFVSSFQDKDVLMLTERELDLCRGYKVLCHAEIEYYFEEIAKIILNESIWLWDTTQKVTLPIVGLMGNYEKIDIKANISTKIHKISQDYISKILRDNHGIKEDNLKKLFTNLGIDLYESGFDSTWLPTLTSYGSSRGLIAHTAASAQTPINIQEAIKETSFILDKLEDFEKEVEAQTKINLYKAEKRQRTPSP